MIQFKLFSEEEIHNTYNKFVNKNKDYLNKFSPFPFHLNKNKWKWEGKDFPRIPCVLDFQDWIIKHNITFFDSVLSTCINDPELEFLSYNKITYLPYDKKNGDFHTLDLNQKFDFVIFNQTIEHLYNPFLSMKNLYNHLNDGGFLFTSLPTINIPHMVPFHFNGFTPIGLCMLMKSVGFEIVELGFWGNFNYISQLFQNHTWPSYEDLLIDNNISNEPKNTVQCWILVQKVNL
jgi:SAM-dependent methyltransferase